MGNGNDKYKGSGFFEEYENLRKQVEAQPKGDAKILFEAFQEFKKGGVTNDEKIKLEGIDAVLKDASIQLTKDGGAVIVDSNGKVTTIKGR